MSCNIYHFCSLPLLSVRCGFTVVILLTVNYNKISEASIYTSTVNNNNAQRHTIYCPHCI